jgi:hypothetical protein
MAGEPEPSSPDLGESERGHLATSALHKRIRAQLRAGAAEVVLSAAEAQQLLLDIGRLQQSSDRLRRQNRRARLRLQRVRLPTELEPIDPGSDGQAP